MLRAVIGDGIAVLGDGNGDLGADRVDLELAVHDHELNVREVLVGVRKVLRLDADRVRARVGALRRPGGGLGLLDALGRIVEIVVRRHGGIALDGVFLAVVGDGIGVLGDGDGDLIADRVDLEPAVHNDDFDIVIVAGGDDEVVLRQTHQVFAGVGARHSRLAGQLNGDRIVGHVGGVALGDVLDAVIGERGGAARDGDGDLIGDRGDLQLAVVRGGDDIASGRVHLADSAFREVRGVLAHISALRADGDIGEAGLDLRAADLVLTGNGEAAHGLLGAVVDMGSAVRRQLEILIIVELDHVQALVRVDDQLFGSRAHGRVALDGLGRFGDLGADLRRGGLALGHFNERSVLVLVVVPVVVDYVLVGVVQLVGIADNVLAPIAERDVRNVGQGAVGLLDSRLHVLGRHGVLRVHDHRAARRDGGDRRSVAVLAHRIAHAGQELRHGVGHDDVLGLVLRHVLHGDGVGDLVADRVVGLGGRGLLLGIERILARDGQGAVFLLDLIVCRHVALGVGDRRTGDLGDRRVNADQRLLILVAVQHGHVQGVAREQASVAVRRFDGAADNGLCRVRHGARVVVGVFQLFGGDLHGALVDDKLTVVHDKSDARKVRAVVREVRFLQPHRVGVRVGARHRVGAAEGEVCFLIKLIVDAHIVAGGVVLRAVIRHGGLVTRDRHDHFVLHRRDGQLARRLGNGVVLCNVRTGGIKDLHGAAERAGVLALLNALGHVGQVLVGMASQQPGRRDAGDALLGSVVDLRIALAGEGHGKLRVGDFELAGRFGHGIVLRNVVAAGVLNDHSAGERAVIAADILSFRLVGQAIVGVVFHKAARRDTGDALHRAGVGERLALAGEGHGARRNGQLADHGLAEGVVIGHILLFTVYRADDAVAVDGVIAGAHVGLAAAARIRYDQRIARHQRTGVGVLMIHQRRAVVDPFIGRRGDGDGIALARGDGELALVPDDVVVAFLEARAGGEGDGVRNRAFIHVGHAAGGLDVGHFAGDEALPAGDVRAGERRAVVFLFLRFRLQGHGAPVNGELAVGHNECDLAEVRVYILEACGRETHGVFVRVDAFRVSACALSKAEIFRLIQAVRNTLDLVAIHAVLFAVIGDGIGAAGDGDDDFLLGRRDGELAGVLGDGIVIRVELRAHLVGDGVLYLTLGHVGHAAGCLDIGHFAGNKAQAANGDIRAGERRAVVGLARRFRRQSHSARRDGERAVHDHELDVREVGVGVFKVARGDADRVGADVDACRRPGGGLGLLDARLDVVERLARRHGLIAGDGVLGAVVGDGVGVFGDGDGDLVADRVDLEHAVHDHELDVREVGVGVFKIARDDADRVFARVGALRRPGIGLGLLDARLNVVEIVVRRHGLVAVDGVLGAVVGDGRAVLGDGDDDLIGDRVDLERAVYDHEFNVREVLIDVCKVARGDADRVFAHGRALRRPRGGGRFLDAGSHVVELVVCRHGLVARDGVLGAVIGDGIGLLGDRDGNLIGDRGDVQIAIHHNDLDAAVVLGGDGEGILRQIHRVMVDVRAGDLCLDAFLQLNGDGTTVHIRGVALGSVLVAIIGERGGVARDLHNGDARRDDDQIAVHDHELNVREVRVGVLEVFRDDADRVGADICARRRPGRGLGLLDARLNIVELVIRRHGLVALDGVLVSVIVDGVGVLGNGNDDLARVRGDRQLAVHDHELDVREVRVGVLEVGRLDADIVCTNGGALRRPGAGRRFGNARFDVVEIVICRHGLIAVDGVFLAVIDDGVGVLGDGDGDLVRVRVDRELAVHDHELDVREVLIDVFKVARDDADIVCTNGGALRRPGVGARLGDARLDVVEIVICRHRLIAVDGVLFAVIGDGVGVLFDRNGDLGGDRVDRQRAGFIRYGVVLGQAAVVVRHGVLVNDVGLRTGVGDGARRRHGEGEVLLRIAVDETGNVKFRLRERIAVIGLARVLRRERQGDGVINGDDVLRGVHLNGDAVAGGIIAFHNSRRILRIQSVRLTRRQDFVDGLGAGLVVGDLHGRTGEIVVDGIACNVELEVQLQHRGAVAGELRRFDVGRGGVKRVLAVFLVRLILGGDGDGGVGRAGALACMIEHAVIIELNGVFGIRVGFPHGVEVVIAAFDIVHHGIAADAEQGAGAVRPGVPAGKRIASAVKRIAAQKLHARVVVERAFVRFGFRGAGVVGMVGQRHGGDLVAPDGVERGLGRNLDLTAGVIVRRRGGLVGAPAEEHLAGGGRQRRCGLHVRVSALRVGLGIRGNGARAAVGVVVHMESSGIDIVGVESDIGIKLGVKIERPVASVFVSGAPALEFPVAGCVRGCRLREQILIDRAAILYRHLRGLPGTFHLGVGNTVYRGRNPFAVDNQIVPGHGAGEVKLIRALGILVPAGEGEVFRYVCGTIGVKACIIRQRGGVFHALRFDDSLSFNRVLQTEALQLVGNVDSSGRGLVPVTDVILPFPPGSARGVGVSRRLRIFIEIISGILRMDRQRAAARGDGFSQFEASIRLLIIIINSCVGFFACAVKIASCDDAVSLCIGGRQIALVAGVPGRREVIGGQQNAAASAAASVTSLGIPAVVRPPLPSFEAGSV